MKKWPYLFVTALSLIVTNIVLAENASTPSNTTIVNQFSSNSQAKIDFTLRFQKKDGGQNSSNPYTIPYGGRLTVPKSDFCLDGSSCNEVTFIYVTAWLNRPNGKMYTCSLPFPVYSNTPVTITFLGGTNSPSPYFGNIGKCHIDHS